MKDQSLKPSLQDFRLIETHVEKITSELNLRKLSFGFYYFVLDLVLNLQEDEIGDSITDTAYLIDLKNMGGHDRGIDAVFIDETETPATVHLFNFKYTNKFKKTTNNFPSREIDKIYNFISDLMQQDESMETSVNTILYSKVKDIWSLYSTQNPKFVIHICSNTYYGFEISEQKRFTRSINTFSNFRIQYHQMLNFITLLTRKDKQIVNARIRAIDKNIFEKSDGDIRALIVNVEAYALLRIVIDEEDIRKNVDLNNYAIIKEHEIIEDAFEDNVRVYLKQRSKINRNIKETALSEEAHRFFYFNNGITITCSHFDYPKQKRSPIIDLEGLQIVNGSQTIHALYDAFKENPKNFEQMEILCRIYETRNESLSTNIAEYTNSQNPVKSRDIRSNDFIQKKLDSELKVLGYYYERKKSQYSDKPKNKRIDAEKAGQALMSFFNKMPGEAKDKKRLIFAEKYDDVFSDEITADSVLLTISLFNEIEKRKLIEKKIMLQNPKKYETKSYILHTSYYLLYTLSELSEIKDVEKVYKKYKNIISMYEVAVKLIEKAISLEMKSLEGYKENYTHRKFFMSNRPKLYLEDLLKKI